MSQQETKDPAKYFYRASAAEFLKIPGAPVAYWASNNLREAFCRLPAFGEIVRPKVGLQTGSNEKFMRFWHEVSFEKIGFHLGSCHEAKHTRSKWFPYNKGGSWRKWYGNTEYVVDWEDNGLRIRGFKDDAGKVRSRPQNTDFYFREGVTWADITTKSFAARYAPKGFIFDVKGSSGFPERKDLEKVIGLMNSRLMDGFMKILNPTSTFQVGDMARVPFGSKFPNGSFLQSNVKSLIQKSKLDWDSYERSWDFSCNPLLSQVGEEASLREVYKNIRNDWSKTAAEAQKLEEENNQILIESYGLEDHLSPKVPLEEVTLTSNPRYRYGSGRTSAELENLLRCDTVREVVSYAVGCIMGRYSLDEPGLIIASQGMRLQDYLSQVVSPTFIPDDDGILPCTEQVWFPDDAANRFAEFMSAACGEKYFKENLDFVAESLCLSAVKAMRGEPALDTIRRYLSTQFYKDHLHTYNRRPIYWLFSSGKEKAFECLVYLHRFNEGTLARLRTEYVIPLSARLHSYSQKLESDKEACSSTSEIKRLEKEIATLYKQQIELSDFDEKLRNYADSRINLDLDGGVKVNYGKLGGLLAEVKVVTGEKAL